MGVVWVRVSLPRLTRAGGTVTQSLTQGGVEVVLKWHVTLMARDAHGT